MLRRNKKKISCTIEIDTADFFLIMTRLNLSWLSYERRERGTECSQVLRVDDASTSASLEDFFYYTAKDFVENSTFPLSDIS